MDRVTLIAALLFSLGLALHGSLTLPQVFAERGHSPRRGALTGAAAGLLGVIAASGLIAQLWPGVGGWAVIGGAAAGAAALAVLRRALPDRRAEHGPLPEGDDFRRGVEARHLHGRIVRILLAAAVAVALLALLALVGTILNKTVGLIAVQYAVEPADLLLNGAPAGRPLEDLSAEDLSHVLAENARPARLRVFILEEVAHAPEDRWPELSPAPLRGVLRGHHYPADWADTPLNKLDESQAAEILHQNLDRAGLEKLVRAEIVKPEIVKGWTLWESLAQRGAINALAAEKFPRAELQWHSWVSWEFLTRPLDPRQPDATGLRPALIGSLLIIAITIGVAFPIGVGAAIYLEEYAAENRLNRVIQTNISNLAGVPSIIYGMLGLVVFVRTLAALTSGNVFGSSTANGRTIFSAGFTLALLVLPLIIINAQEAIRAVPASLRQASYGLGATQWQTIWHQVLPHALPGILTGTILAISRALGETAPLILVGAATYITQDPKGPFSNFTALPILIYRWTGLPQAEFRNAAAAAIVVLLVLLLTLNSVAVILRGRLSRRIA